jgi:NitT/TauT family transport system substrate-binding protein
MLTQVMSDQIDVGWNSDGGVSFREWRDKVRVIGTGGELLNFRDLSVRTIISNDDNLKNRRDVIGRFLQAYQDTLDWMYGPGENQALQWHAEQKKISVAEARRVRDAIYPREGLRLGPLGGVELSIKQAVDSKRIPAPISVQQFNQYVDIVWQPPR